MTDQEPQTRLDLALVARGYAATRSRARDLILRGLVTVDGQPAAKPSVSVRPDAKFAVAGDTSQVSRGAEKLRAALDAFGFCASNRVCLDVGASTGGFTQVLLADGAVKVFAVDVGHGQLAHRLRQDARVVCLEGQDARGLKLELTGPVDAIVADVSFISLLKALPAPLALAKSGAWLVALIKPQFEVGRDGVGKGGIVRSEALRQGAVEAARDWLAGQPGWTVSGVIASPIAGGSGNIEYLIGARRDG
jgi:23S rRNA (cytidine1920-2'-O)/16S rRNA (cytidine1409-2'-O)-methyltransferase